MTRWLPETPRLPRVALAPMSRHPPREGIGAAGIRAPRPRSRPLWVAKVWGPLLQVITAHLPVRK